MFAMGMQLPGLHDRAQALAALPALGLLTVAAFTPAGWNMTYRDPASVDDALIESILAERPNVVAISALTASALEAYRLSERLRAEGVGTVFGGLHATACPAEAMQHFNAVVVGDGEPSWPDALEHASVRGSPRVFQTLNFDLGESRMPRWDLLSQRDRPRFTLQTARGCPLACDFCAASRMLGPFREKPAALIAAELDAIRELSRRPVVELADDNTFVGRRDARELLGVLQRSGIRYFTEADWRIGERPDVLDALAASGCVQVLVGLESTSSRHQGMGGKRAELGRVMDAVGRIQEAGVAVIGCVVAGGDGEDHESLAELAQFLVDAPLADAQVTMMTPFPGSPIHARLAAQGRLLPERTWNAYTLFDVVHRPDRLSPEELQNGYYNVVRMAFSPEVSRRRRTLRAEIWARRGLPAVRSDAC